MGDRERQRMEGSNEGGTSKKATGPLAIKR